MELKELVNINIYSVWLTEYIALESEEHQKIKFIACDRKILLFLFSC